MSDRHVEKIKKLLALGSSANEHEAALALEHAQRLMAEHNITLTDVSLSDVKTASKPMSRTKTPPGYLQDLAVLVGCAFGCQMILNHKWVDWGRWESSVTFVGIESAAELSGYAFDVLRRQLERDRKEFLKTLKRCKRPTKVRRAEAFSRAWIGSVGSKVARLVPNAEHDALIKAWREREYEDRLDIAIRKENRKLKNADIGSVLAGAAAGESAQLHAGMSATDRLKIGV